MTVVELSNWPVNGRHSNRMLPLKLYQQPSILCAPTILQLPLLLALQHALRLRQLQHYGKRLIPTSRTLYIFIDDGFQDQPTPAYFLTTFDTDYVWRYFLRTISIPDPPCGSEERQRRTYPLPSLATG